MLLEADGIESFDQVAELWASKKSPIDVQKFADFLSDYDSDHKIIVECSGTMAQVASLIPTLLTIHATLLSVLLLLLLGLPSSAAAVSEK